MMAFEGADGVSARRALFGVAALALLLRLILLFGLPEWGAHLVAGIPRPGVADVPSSRLAYLDRRTDFLWLTEDETCYDQLARAAIAGRGFTLERGWMVAPPGKPTSYGGFTYPAFVTAMYALAGGRHQLPIYLVQCLLGAATVFGVFAIGRRIAGPRVGLIAAALFGVNPFTAWASVAMMTEAIFLPLVVGSIAFALRAWNSGRARDWAITGGIFGIACLTRSTLLYFLPVILVGLALRHRGIAPIVRPALALLVVFAATILPWTVRNYRVHERFLLLDTKAGTNLWQYNNPNMVPEFGFRAAGGEPPVPITPLETARRGGNEVDQDRAYARMVYAYARAEPAHFVSVLAHRAILALSPLPTTNLRPLNVVVGLLFRGTLLVFALLGWLLLRRNWRAHFLVLALPVYWWALQTLSGPGHRYRLPVDFVYGVLAAVGLAAAHAWMRRRSMPPSLSTQG